MQYYLSNRSSRAGSANENFARELFELHSLGRSAYLNDHYDRWREVPGALQGRPSGYIDQDVYEAARAFTGWTIEDGSGIDAHRKLPQTGQFVYVDGWHDGYQKRVLATEFDAFAPALADGRRVLDLIAAHPATADFVCDKLCQRLIGASAAPPLRRKLVAVWLDNVESRDQIARVLRTVLLSGEFAAARGTKMRRPLNLAAAFARALQIDLNYAEPLGGELAAAGQNLFGWPTPTGLPDTPAQLGVARPTTAAAATALLNALLGTAPPATVAEIVTGSGWPADQPLDVAGAADAAHRWTRLAAYCAMSRDFQVS